MASLLIYLTLSVCFVVFVLVVNKYFNEEREAILIVSSMILIFILVSRALINKNLSQVDDFAYNLIRPIISERLTSLMIFITHLSSAPILIVVSIVSFIILYNSEKNKHYGYIIVFNLLATYALNVALKFIYKRERPNIMRLVDIEGFSFPSGHSMVSISFYGLILYLLFINMKNRTYRILTTSFLALMIILIGFSRIYLGVHYVTDVLAGFTAGSSWLIMVIVFTNNYLVKRFIREPHND